MRAAVLSLLLVALAVANARDLLDASLHADHAVQQRCWIEEVLSCGPKDPVKCGGATCAAGQVCSTVKKEVVDPKAFIDPKMYDPNHVTCKDPRLVCHEIWVPCGNDGLECAFNEKCVTQQVCEKDPVWHELVCKDNFVCQKFEPKVCKIQDIFQCIKGRDPATQSAGLFHGYEMDWMVDHKAGTACGDTVCAAGEFCAKCAVEVCDSEVVAAEGVACGPNAFCDPGHMCLEICDKSLIMSVDVATCAADTTRATCGSTTCAVGEKCNVGTVKVCEPVEQVVAVKESPRVVATSPTKTVTKPTTRTVTKPTKKVVVVDDDDDDDNGEETATSTTIVGADDDEVLAITATNTTNGGEANATGIAANLNAAVASLSQSGNGASDTLVATLINGLGQTALGTASADDDISGR